MAHGRPIRGISELFEFGLTLVKLLPVGCSGLVEIMDLHEIGCSICSDDGVWMASLDTFAYAGSPSSRESLLEIHLPPKNTKIHAR